MKYNCNGKVLNTPPALKSYDYGYYDSKGMIHIYWSQSNESCDESGFDKSFRPCVESDDYVIEDYIIPRGTMLCRYGSPRGVFTTLKGTDYDLLSLPYVKESIEYHEYQVSIELHVKCRVIRGRVAPMFDSTGGAEQYKHYRSIKQECEQGILKEVFLWE